MVQKFIRDFLLQMKIRKKSITKYVLRYNKKKIEEYKSSYKYRSMDALNRPLFFSPNFNVAYKIVADFLKEQFISYYYEYRGYKIEKSVLIINSFRIGTISISKDYLIPCLKEDI